MPSTLPYVPTLPNAGSKNRTPASVAIDGHYAGLLLVERWNWDRFARLCSFAAMTAEEVASIVMMPHAWISGYRETKTLPDSMCARPIALLLTILEAHWIGTLKPSDVIADPFPKIV